MRAKLKTNGKNRILKGSSAPPPPFAAWNLIWSPLNTPTQRKIFNADSIKNKANEEVEEKSEIASKFSTWQNEWVWRWPSIVWAKVERVWGGKWRRLRFDDGCLSVAGGREGRKHCKLARPSAKPIIRTEEERQTNASVRCRGRAAAGSVGRQLIYYEHLTSILQGGFREAALIY